jgi:PadR family transcriptional regulator PadR
MEKARLFLGWGHNGIEFAAIDISTPPGSMFYMVLKSTGQDRRTQLLHGVLDMCLISIIDEEPSYGYEMVRKLRKRGLDLTSEGSIYPLLSRLQKQGMIEGYLVQSSEGPARKYYRMSDRGREALGQWQDDWGGFRNSVDAVLSGGDDD